ncbi:MAG: HD domain-containing protein [Gemmatimonadales bacterium]|nr:MAG: HD domain-containing protein [Gemmatimonadales bacterium]
MLEAAARGILPSWGEMGPLRREHTIRVGAVMGSWASELGLPDHEVGRWRAAGLLHDVLRDADPDGLRRELGPPLGELPPAILHGPAAAARLQALGVTDEPLLEAIRWHTLGDPGLDRLGRALYCADFLEPGRRRDRTWREGLRYRFPLDEDGVLVAVTRERTAHQEAASGELHPRTRAFRERVLGGGPPGVGPSVDELREDEGPENGAGEDEGTGDRAGEDEGAGNRAGEDAAPPATSGGGTS